MSTIILTDSSCDIRGDEIEKFNIKVIPLNVTFGTENFKDGVDLTVEEFYKKLHEVKEFPRTSQPSPQDYVNVFEEAKKNNDEVICLTISSGLSGTYQTALLAKDIAEYDNVYVCDSLTCLTGLRCLVVNACKMRDNGATAKEIFEKMEYLKNHIHLFSIVDTLDGFLKGGRMSKASYTVASLLNIKPFITLDKTGHIIKNGQSLGYLKAYIVASGQTKKFPILPEYGVFYGYTEGEDKLDKFIEKTFKQFDNVDSYDRSRIGCAAGAHIGGGAVCMVYISSEERND
ncbi:MAG: DegV family protein [Acholeplasmatales bacterium]|nr:DegV family protein [Acholeplasmatales bacterium]